MLKSILLIVIGSYFGIMILMYLIQSKLLFFPSKEILATPSLLNLSYKDIYFETSDNVKINAWYTPSENSEKVVIICHGNAGNISNRLETIQIFNNVGISSLIFDYRGYGKSEGKISEYGSYLDSEAAWNYLVNDLNYSSENIYIFGRSLGGGIASWLAVSKMPKALILESTFTSVPDMASDIYPFLPVKFLSRFDYNTIDRIKNIKCPILIIHSKNDEIIPYKFGLKIFEKANEPKIFFEISGGHNDGFIISLEKYKEKLHSFIIENKFK